MYYTYKGVDYAIRFAHNTEEIHVQEGQELYTVPRQTACIVALKGISSEDIISGKAETTAVGIARVHPRDNFSKEIGRQVAFGHAIKQFIDKADRLDAWKAYAFWKSDKSRLSWISEPQTKEANVL